MNKILKTRVVVQTKNGGHRYDGAWRSDRDEADGWEHMLTTTIEGERLQDVGVALLDCGLARRTVYIPVDAIESVTIEWAEM